MKYRINEIFYSIQGEGRWAGTPMIFIRFAGCNMRCRFCDTDHEAYTLMSAADILARINNTPGRYVCLTGGEPGMQVDGELVDLLHRQGRTVHIETNGTYPIPANIDWVTVSPKAGKLAVERADEIKVVYLDQNVEKWESFPAEHHYLQPCSGENTGKVINYIKRHPRWKISVQLHKLLKIQ